MNDPCVRSISPTTELELKRLVFDNAVRGFEYVMVCKLVIVLVTLLTVSRIGKCLPTTPFLCVAVLFAACGLTVYFFVFVYLFLGTFVKIGYGEIVCKLCGTRFMKKFLMLHYPNRCLTEKVLRLIEDDLRDCESLLEAEHAS